MALDSTPLDKNPRTKPRFTRNIAIWAYATTALFAWSILLLIGGLSKLVLSQQAKTWPTTAATINRTWITSSSLIWNRPWLSYTYRVANKEYNAEGNASGIYRRYDEAQDELSRFRPGAAISIRYDPNDPRRSLWLVQETSSDAFDLLLGGGLIFIIVGVSAHLAWQKRSTDLKS